MFCNNCGAQLEDEMDFCMQCGAKVSKVNLNSEVNCTETNKANNEILPKIKTPQKHVNIQGRKKWAALIAIIIVIIVTVAATYIFFNKRKNSVGDTVYILKGYLDIDDNMYFLKENGETVVIEAEENAEGWMTSDRKHIILLCNDEVSVYDGNGKLEDVLNDNADNILKVSNKGIVYEQIDEPAFEDVIKQLQNDYNELWGTDYIYGDFLDSLDSWGYSRSVEDAENFYYSLIGENVTVTTDHRAYRYTFDNRKNIEITEYSEIWISDDLSIAYTTDVGIFLLKSNDVEAAKIQGQKHDDISIVSIYDDGNILVWTDNIRSEVSFSAEVYIWKNGIINSLGKMEIENGYSPVNAFLLNNKKEILCISSGSEDVLYATISGSSVNKFSAKGKVQVSSCYSQYGQMTSEIEEKINGFYALIDQDLFYISLDAERERLVSDVIAINEVYNNKIFYTKGNEDANDLYCASISAGKIENEERIARRIGWVIDAVNGVVYYMKDYDNSMGTLYSIDSKGEAEKIATDVFRAELDANGRLLYCKDVDYLYYLSLEYGALYLGDSKIETDVLDYAIFSEQMGTKQMGILQYDYVISNDDGSESIMCNLCYYDGKKADRIASDIIYATY